MNGFTLSPACLVLVLFSSAARAFINDKLVVLGGYTDRRVDNVEVLDLSPTNPQTCADLPRLPAAMEGLMATFIDDRIRFCGGMDDSHAARRECHVLDDGRWAADGQMLRARSYAGSVTDGRTWYILGGVDNGVYTKTTEVYRDGAFSPWIDLPEAIADHCAIHLGPDHLFVAGGRTAGQVFSKKSHVLPLAGGDAARWDTLPDMSAPHESPFCSPVVGRDELQVMVAGGRTTGPEATDLVEIFSFKSNHWRSGPSLPQRMAYLHTLESGDAAMPYMNVGGHSPEEGNVGAIMMYRDENDTWVLLDRSLRVPRSGTQAVLVNSFAVACA